MKHNLGQKENKIEILNKEELGPSFILYYKFYKMFHLGTLKWLIIHKAKALFES